MARRAALLVLVVLGFATACSSTEPRRGEPLASLDAGFEPLRKAFDESVAHVRILAILSPT